MTNLEFTPTVWKSYEQVKPLVSGKGLKLADIKDPYLREVRFANMDISNLMKFKVAGAKNGTPEYYANRSVSKAVGLICEKREALAKLYLDRVDKKAIL
jgi:hypothetical protein